MDIFTVTDPSDWPTSMPELKTIDTLLRCGICYEFFDIAMILPKCSHNYCSMCIRRYMNYKQQCPTCNSPAETSQLCNNRTLDELVSNFKAVRPHILKLCREEAAKNAQGASDHPPPPKKLSSPPVQQPGGKKKKKTSPYFKKATDYSQESDGDFKTDTSHTAPLETPKRAGQRRSNYQSARDKIASYASESTTSASDEEQPSSLDRSDAAPYTATSPTSLALNKSNEENVDPTYNPADELGEGDVVVTPVKSLVPSTSRGHGSQAGSSGENGATPATPATRSEKVACPVCAVPISSKHINSHLDSCLTRSEEKEARKRVPKRKPLPKLVASLLSDKELRKKLREHGLNTQGQRLALSKRLLEFTLMYNAQCDSTNPMPVDVLVREFNKMDKIKSQSNLALADQRLKISRSHSAEQIENTQKTYLKSHSSQFQDLIKNAKEHMKAKQAAKEQEAKKEQLEKQRNSHQDVNSKEEAKTETQPIAEENHVQMLNASETEGGGLESTGSTGVQEEGKDKVTVVDDDNAEETIVDGSSEEGADDVCSEARPAADGHVGMKLDSVGAVVKRVDLVNSEEMMDMSDDEVSPVFGRCSIGSSPGIAGRSSGFAGGSDGMAGSSGSNTGADSSMKNTDAVKSENSGEAPSTSASSVPSPPDSLLLNDIDNTSEGSSLITLETYSETSGSGSHGDPPSPSDVNCIPASPEAAAEGKTARRLGRKVRKRKPEVSGEEDGTDTAGGSSLRVTRLRKRGKTSVN